MNKRWLYVLLGVLAFIVVLGIGGVIGGSIVYSRMKSESSHWVNIEPGIPHLEIGIPSGKIFIIEVVADSPAAEAGLQEGDVILKVDGEEVGPGSDLGEMIRGYQPGDTITLRIQRLEEVDELEIEVALGENPEEADQAYLGIGYASGFSSMHHERLPYFYQYHQFDEDFPFYDLPHRHLMEPHWVPEGVESAVIIGEVLDDTPASETGLQEGDFITELDGEPVGDPEAFADAIQKGKPGEQVTLTVYHKGDDQPQEIEIILGEHPEESSRGYIGIGLRGFLHIKGEGPTFFGGPFNFEFDFDFDEEFTTPKGDV